MTREERDRLLARYGAGDIHPLEREKLFSEALRDQELFNELFAEEALEEALADAEVRRAVMAAETPRPAAWQARWRWAALGAVAASVALGVFLIRMQVEKEPGGELVARAVPPRVTSIEPLAAPMPQSLEAAPAAAPAARAVKSGAAGEASAAGAAEAQAVPAPVPFAAPAPDGAEREKAAPPLRARIEFQDAEGGWKAAAQGEELPAGVPLRLSVAADEPVVIAAGGVRGAVLPGQERTFPLPAFTPGDHEFRVEWAPGPATAGLTAARARLMSEAPAGPAALAGQAADRPAVVLRFRIR